MRIMQELKTNRMKVLLKQGIRKAKKIKAPSEGSLIGLMQITLKNGWYYQVDFIRDLRIHNKPYVIVYAFKPPLRFYARSADYYLSKEIN